MLDLHSKRATPHVIPHLMRNPRDNKITFKTGKEQSSNQSESLFYKNIHTYFKNPGFLVKPGMT